MSRPSVCKKRRRPPGRNDHAQDVIDVARHPINRHAFFHRDDFGGEVRKRLCGMIVDLDRDEDGQSQSEFERIEQHDATLDHARVIEPL